MGIHDIDRQHSTSLEKFRALHAYNPRAGGIAIPPPISFSEFQGAVVEGRLRLAQERLERERFQHETGITIVQEVEMRDIAEAGWP